MPTGSIVLTGAPPQSSLQWGPTDLLAHPPPFIIREHQSVCESPVRWRSLGPLARQVVRDLAPGDEATAQGALFYAGGNIERYSGMGADKDEATISEFYDQSFALHEGLGSFGPSDDGDTLNDTTSLLEDSMLDTFEDPSTGDANPPAAVGHLSDLEDLPDAAYITAVAPRIITVNLIAAVVNISPRRRVRTHWGREMDIVEVLVGDDTRSGFRVTCWLPVLADGMRQSPLEQALSTLRLRDIVLIRAVALNSFRGQVYGQSLRDNMTKVDLMSRMPIDPTDTEGVFKWKTVAQPARGKVEPQLRKVRKVRQWLLNFLGPVARLESENRLVADKATHAYLPSDTQ